MRQAVEITTFKLRTGTFKEFIEANKADIDSWLKKQKGFQTRYILEKKDGTVVDMVFWKTSEQGTDAMSRIISETAHSPVHSMIDQRSVSWNIYNVAHVVTLQ